jgi:hypothetical protein
MNPNHLELMGISTHIILKALTVDSLNVNIKRLAFKEKSGMELKRLSLKFEGGRKNSTLHELKIRMPHTDFQTGPIEATYHFRGDHFVMPSLSYNGSILHSDITLADLSCLLPPLKTFNSTLSLAATFKGQGEDIDIPSLTITSTTGDINADLSGLVRKLQSNQPVWQATVNELSLSARTIGFIAENLKGEQISIPEIVNRMGSMRMKGTANGTGNAELRTSCQLNTDAGNMTLKFGMEGERRFSGSIDTQDINLQKLLDDNHFGMLATKIELNGLMPDNGHTKVTAEGVVHKFDYNGYNFRNINLDGSYNDGNLKGRLSIDDPNLGLNIQGVLERKGKTSDVKLSANVLNFSPQAINLTDQWENARFFGDLRADFKASNINDAIGILDITNLIMQSSSENYELDEFHLESGYDNNTHYVKMNSDFGEAHISGDFNYETLLESFTNHLAVKLPTLSGLPKVNPDTKNNFAINAVIRKSDWMQHLFHLPIVLKEPLMLRGAVNDHNRQVAMECQIPRFYYDGQQYDNGRFSIVSPINTLQYDFSVTKIADDGDNIDLQLTGSAFNNQLAASLLWDNHAKEQMSGKITASATFDSSFDGKQTVFLNMAPSQIKIRNTDWSIKPCKMTYYKNHLELNDFTIQHQQQYLTLNGVASESEQDSVSINMREIDIEYVLDLVNFDAVSFSGKATGKGSIRALFGNLEADGKLRVDSFLFEHGRMGILSADVVWNKEKEQIDIHAIADDGADAMTYIDGFVSPKREFIDLGIRAEGTHMDFAQSFTSSFMDKVEGHVNGEVRLAGPLSAINLTGQLVLNGYAHVRTLGCTYELRNDTLRLVPNEMMFANCAIYDTRGKQSILTGGIHHKDLTRLTFDIYVDARDLLAYDFHNFGDDVFYGTVYATGKVGIHGREGSVTIDADVTPQPGSVFVYNAASPDAAGKVEFIQWGNSQDKDAKNAISANGKNNAQTDTTNVSSFLDRSDLTLRLKINATPNATIRLLMDPVTNDYINLRGNGILQATYYNKGGFNMFGTYRVTEGTYGITIQDIIKKNFVFLEGGTVAFGGDPYEAALNLQAQHTVNGVSLSDLNVGRSFSNTVRVNCLMNITGQPRSPIIDFDIDIPNVNSDEKQMVRSVINGEEEMNQQVIYLLAVGRFYPQGANNAGDTDGGPSKTSLAMQSLLSGTLSGQINNVLNSVIKSKNWNFGANISTGDEGWNNAEYEGLISGRLLNNRLLINGQFGYRDNATTASPSFIGDFDIRYLLFPNGNLALKVYNQTNDRYFTRSSLTTQGIGIIMKKDFGNMRELFSRNKNKKKQNKKSVK